MSQFCILNLCFLHSVTIHLYAIIRRNLKLDSAIPSTSTGLSTLWSSPSTLYSFAEYLVLDDWGCLNALLPSDFIPLTSDHLFWDRNLESFLSALRLVVMSGRFYRHRQFYGNTSMSPDRWILSSVWPQHIYSHFLVCTLVPWFPFSLLVGDLTSVNGIHQWPVIRRWTTMFDLDTSIHIVGLVLVVVCVEDLPYWWHLIYATSLIMPVFMRFQLSWLYSSLCQTFLAIMEILIYCISSVIMEIMVICISSSWRF